jgi:hypothetical protein
MGFRAGRLHRHAEVQLRVQARRLAEAVAFRSAVENLRVMAKRIQDLELDIKKARVSVRKQPSPGPYGFATYPDIGKVCQGKRSIKEHEKLISQLLRSVSP